MEAVIPKDVNNMNADHFVAYVAVEDEGNYFLKAGELVDFFLLTHCLCTGVAVNVKAGAGFPIKSYDELGKRRVSFDYEALHVLYDGDPMSEFWARPLLDSQKLYLELLPERQKIMESHLGIALLYYYYAVNAAKRRLEEVVIDLAIASEALLVAENGSICGPLCRRLAMLIGKDEPDRRQIAKSMRELYSLRSSIVHGRGKKPTFVNAKQLFGYVRQAIEKALALRALSKEELNKKLDAEWTEAAS